MRTNDIKQAFNFILGQKAYYHHSASRKGYRHSCANSSPNKNSAYRKAYEVEEYTGRYGKGYVLIYPNSEGIINRFGKTHKSNNFYRIEYYLF